MYKLKDKPEDFIVKEISQIQTKESGEFAICKLIKKNYTTQRAIEHIAKKLHIPLKHIGFAGTKDKNALTEQYISIKKIRKQKIENLSLQDITIEFLGYTDEPIYLGNLQGNQFIITVRNIGQDQIKQLEKRITTKQIMPNYFGEQRFSTKNAQIGKAIIKKDEKQAVKLILESDSDYKEAILKHQNSPVTALQSIPTKVLQFYTHAYQSLIWNKTLSGYKGKNTEIPLIGFGTEVENSKIDTIIEEIMAEENLHFRDFINRKLPQLSLEGSERVAHVEIMKLEITNKTENTITLEFQLPKASYATVAIAYLFDCLDTTLADFI